MRGRPRRRPLATTAFWRYQARVGQCSGMTPDSAHPELVEQPTVTAIAIVTQPRSILAIRVIGLARVLRLAR